MSIKKKKFALGLLLIFGYYFTKTINVINNVYVIPEYEWVLLVLSGGLAFYFFIVNKNVDAYYLLLSFSLLLFWGKDLYVSNKIYFVSTIVAAYTFYALSAIIFIRKVNVE